MHQKIALGFGNNIDYEITVDANTIETLINTYQIKEKELDTNIPVRTERDLLISILGFLKSGTGGERFVESTETLEQFAKKFDKKITLGGTSVRAAIAMRKFGHTAALHLVTINDDVRRLLPADCTYVCSATNDSLYPHLIVQFKKNTRIKASDINICSHQANRIIYHNDTDNITMKLNPAFSELITNAEVFLISGFNAMQNETQFKTRLNQILKILEFLPEHAHVYYEDAGYFNARFRHALLTTLRPKISVLGLNEDELQAHLDRPIDLLNPAQIKQALEDLQQSIHIPTIVVHSKYWAIAYGKNAAAFAKALKGGVTMATTRFCYGDDFTPEQYQQIHDSAPQPEAVTFIQELTTLLNDSVCCVPVAQVAQSSANAVGLGDAFVGGFLPELLPQN